MEIYNSTTQPPPSFMDKLHGEKADYWLSFWALFFMRVVVVSIYLFVVPFLLVCCYCFISFLVNLVGVVCRLGTRLGWPKLSKEEFDYLTDLPKKLPDLKQTKQLWITASSVPFAPLSELKGTKVDQSHNLLKTHKTVGTLEELLIMP